MNKFAVKFLCWLCSICEKYEIAVLMFVMLMREREKEELQKNWLFSLTLLTIYAVPVHKEMHQLGVVVLYLVLKVF